MCFQRNATNKAEKLLFLFGFTFKNNSMKYDIFHDTHENSCLGTVRFDPDSLRT